MKHSERRSPSGTLAPFATVPLALQTLRRALPQTQVRKSIDLAKHAIGGACVTAVSLFGRRAV